MKRHSQHIYEYAIIGSGLTGLILGAHLSQFSDDFALIESNDYVGGVNRPIQIPGIGTVNNGIRFLPYAETLMPLLKSLEAVLGECLIGPVKECPPVTYDNGSLKPFLGFGDNPPDFYKELNYFTATQQIELLIPIHQWPELLFKKIRGDFMPRSYVTKFHKPENMEDGNFLSHLTINGSKNLAAKNFIFCGSLKDLVVLLPKGILSARAQSKLNRDTYWTALCLDLVHSQKISASDAIHILNGTTQDEIGPCAGRFLPCPVLESQILALPTDSALEADPLTTTLEPIATATPTEVPPPLQCSQWITYVDEFTSEDSEVVANALKKIKRQIKRAYPNALEQLKHERIMVAPAVAGNGDLKLSHQNTLSGLNNLFIACGAMSEFANIWGTLEHTQKIISALKLGSPQKESSEVEKSHCSL